MGAEVSTGFSDSLTVQTPKSLVVSDRGEALLGFAPWNVHDMSLSGRKMSAGHETRPAVPGPEECAQTAAHTVAREDL